MIIDSFVVLLVEFFGGDIGKIVVCGIVNDLVVGGVKLFWLLVVFIIEEGCEIVLLCWVVVFMQIEVEKVGVWIVIGDIKVVGKGVVDKFFVMMIGVGVILLG